MQPILKSLMFVWGAVILLSFAPQAFAQSLSNYISQTAPPDWIVAQTVPLGPSELSQEQSKFYRLVDWQQRISKSGNERYRHNAIELKTADAVQDNSNFKISFDPSYEKVKLHKLDLIRNGKRLNRLKLSDFDMYRLETDRDKLLYNGDLQTALIIPDVRVGDILDYSYSISGQNQALGPHYRSTTTLQYSVPMLRQHERILIHNNVPAYIKTFQNPIAPIEKQIGEYRSYSWLQNDVKELDIEDNLPAWYYAQPTHIFSSFKTWNEVGEYFTQHYQLNYAKGGEISDIAKTIMDKSDNDKTRSRLALDYIHDNIRYTGIEIGSGGYVPRPPEKTLAQKFGDCKDMTVLLLAILKEMDIEAYPILVDGDYRGGLKNLIPSHGAFDHVLVRAEVNGESFLLDGTRGKQLGDLDRIEQSSYGKGLLLQPGNARLIDLELKQPTYYKDVQDTFELLSDTVTLESLTTYFGYEADSVNSSYVNDGVKEMEKNFLSFFQKTYPEIKQVGDMEINSFPAMGKLTIKVNYDLGQGWVEHTEENYKGFEAYPSDVTSDIPNFKGGSREMPYSLSHPRKSRHKLIFKLDETWDLNEDEIIVENEAFKYQKTSTFKNGVYTEEYTYQSKLDHIPPALFSEAMADLKKLEDENGVELTLGTDWLSNLSETYILGIFGLWIVCAILLSLIGAIIRNDIDLDWQKDQIFYPIALSKFILLSIVSIGFYCYFWAYKNWRWMRDVGEHPNTPILRSFFMSLTNIALLPHFADYDDKNEGYPWYGAGIAIVLAVLFLALDIMGNVADEIDGVPVWISGLSIINFALLIPAVMQINRLNNGREEVIAKNSAYHWTTIAFIILFAPVLMVLLFGLFA